MIYEIGERIRISREIAGLKSIELAERLGISASKMSNWENGTNRPNADQIAEIVVALGIDANYILGINNNLNDDVQKLCAELKMLCLKMNKLGMKMIEGYAKYISTQDEYKKYTLEIEEGGKRAG